MYRFTKWYKMSASLTLNVDIRMIEHSKVRLSRCSPDAQPRPSMLSWINTKEAGTGLLATQVANKRVSFELRLRGLVPATKDKNSPQACTVRIVIRTTQMHGAQRQNCRQLQWFNPLTQNWEGSVGLTEGSFGSNQQSTEETRGNRDSTLLP